MRQAAFAAYSYKRISGIYVFAILIISIHRNVSIFNRNWVKLKWVDVIRITGGADEWRRELRIFPVNGFIS